MHHMDDPLYDNIAAFTAGLVANGVTDVVISPGSRSTPLAITLDAHPALRTWIQLDERSAAFFALGMARVTGVPAVLVCTSGTAAANYLPAVVEAHHAGVPMIVCTADRPPELQGWGAGQTIDQHGIFGNATRWAANLPVASEWNTVQAERTAMRAVAAATGADPGPVHLNWPFRLPLEPKVAPVVRDAMFHPSATTSRGASAESVELLRDLARIERGVVVVGPHDGMGLQGEHSLAAAIMGFAHAARWPVIGEPLTQLRRMNTGTDTANVVANAGRLLDDPTFSARYAPSVVVRVGRAPTTKSVRLWMESHRPGRVVLIDPAGHWQEPSFTLTDHLSDDPTALINAAAQALDDSNPVDGLSSSAWLDSWLAADEAAEAAIGSVLTTDPLMAAGTARVFVESMPAGSVLVTSNSMPVRDLDSFVPVGTPEVSIVGNRGASGIDGITSTALGAAAASASPVAMLIGDIALLHDLGGLTAARRLGIHLTAVCVDNDGGEIFSMLPIAAHGSDVEFDRLFRTSHGVDLSGLHGFAGIEVSVAESAEQLSQLIGESMAEDRPGIDLIIVRFDPDADIDQHRRLAAAISEAVTG